jgi:dynein heavy chain
MNIENCLIVAAIAPPGGGRQNITQRLTRHFNILSIESFDDDLMKTIFQPIMDWYFTKSAYPPEYNKMSTVKSFL